MSFIGGITDFLTGGSNQQAEQALNDALNVINQVRPPTKEDLTLPELQRYVQMGLLTPAQAEAVLQSQSAYDGINLDPRAREASIDALNKLEDISDDGMNAGMEARLYDTQSKMNQALQGQRASILDQMAQRGIPTSLMGVSAQLAFAGQDAEQAHKDALQAQADAEARALAAMEATGSLGNQIQGQQFNEASTKAAAQNAINQWNSQIQTQINQGNANARQQAASFNKQNEQAVSNANVQNANARTQYNAAIPQQIYNNAMQKAETMANIYGAKAKDYARVGEQNAGTSAAMIDLLTPSASFMGMGVNPHASGAQAGTAGGAGGAGAGGGMSAPQVPQMADMGGFMAAEGGKVPGQPEVPGDSPINDKVHALLSPGEVVIPRSKADNPAEAASFVRDLNRMPHKPVHPEDIKAVLEALTIHRTGGI